MSRPIVFIEEAEAGAPAAAPYELFAIKYAHNPSRRSAVFLGGDVHDGPMPMDYFVWLAVGKDRKVLIDTGFKKSVADRRGRDWRCCPGDAITAFGVQPDEITDVVVTHLHFDHAGNIDKFPSATVHLQEREMGFATGRHMAVRHASFGKSFEDEDVVHVIRRLYAGRVALRDGDAQLAPGLQVYLVGGHTPGMQIVRVWTARGWVLLVSDASHYYENINAGRPFFIYHDLGDVFDSYRRIRRLSPSIDHVIPGHDPLVMDQYPAPRQAVQGLAVRLDVAPKFSAMTEGASY